MKILENLKVDKDLFGKLALYGTIFFALAFLIGELFSMLLKFSAEKSVSILNLQDAAEVALEEAGPQVSGLYGAVIFLIALLVLFILAELYNFSFFENLIWNTIFKKKTTFKNTNKFFLLMFSLIVLAVIAASIVFLLISFFSGMLLKIGVGIFYAAVLFLIYLIFVGFYVFGRTRSFMEAIKGAYTVGIKGLDAAIVPLLMAFLVMILLNAVLWVFMQLSFVPFTFNFILQMAALAAYLAWFRIYLAKALKSVKL